MVPGKATVGDSCRPPRGSTGRPERAARGPAPRCRVKHRRPPACPCSLHAAADGVTSLKVVHVATGEQVMIGNPNVWYIGYRYPWAEEDRDTLPTLSVAGAPGNLRGVLSF